MRNNASIRNNNNPTQSNITLGMISYGMPYRNIREQIVTYFSLPGPNAVHATDATAREVGQRSNTFPRRVLVAAPGKTPTTSRAGPAGAVARGPHAYCFVWGVRVSVCGTVEGRCTTVARPVSLHRRGGAQCGAPPRHPRALHRVSTGPAHAATPGPRCRCPTRRDTRGARGSGVLGAPVMALRSRRPGPARPGPRTSRPGPRTFRPCAPAAGKCEA